MTSGASKIPYPYLKTYLVLKCKSVPPNVVSSLGNVGLAEENFHVRTNVDRFELPVGVGEVLLRFDYQDVPLSENRLGYMSDSETLEWYWEIVSNPESPRLKEVTPPSPFSTPPYQDSNQDSTEFNHLETPVKSRPCYSPEYPPVAKKKKLENHPTFSHKVKTVDLSKL